MRASRFVEHLPAVMPPLLDVTELEASVMRDRVHITYSAAIYDQSRTASLSFTNGAPNGELLLVSDLYQMRELKNHHAAVVAGDTIALHRSALDTSLAALLRISEGDTTVFKGTSRRWLGRDALWLTEAAVRMSLSTGPARYDCGSVYVENRDPQAKLVERADSYTALLPYLGRNQRRRITEGLYGNN